MTGSEKQVQWATEIRMGIVDDLDRPSDAVGQTYRERYGERAGTDVVALFMEWLYSHTDARWFIDHRRSLNGGRALRRMSFNIKDGLEATFDL